MKKEITRIFIIILFLSSSIYSQYDVSFLPLKDMTSHRYGMGYTTDGKYIYAISGGTNISPWVSNSMEKYDFVTNSWQENISGLISRRYCSSEYISSLNKIFIFNGNSLLSNTHTDTIEIVDISNNSITYNTSNPFPVEYAGSAVWNNKIYVFGGANDTSYSQRLYEFNPESFEWIRLPDMPEAKQTSGRVVNGILYVFGGYNGTTSSRIDAYDIHNQTWSFIGNMPKGISAYATAVAEKYIWLVGSYSDLHLLAIFNTETSEFSILTTNMLGRRHAGAIVVGDSLYIFGGNQSSSSESVLNSLEVADISNYIVSVQDIENNTLNSYKLSQNYPNPFNPSTTISYKLPQIGFVQLKVYDMLGREVANLVNKVQSPGNYKVKFNASSLPSGVYFYRLQSGNFSEIKKLNLLR